MAREVNVAQKLYTLSGETLKQGGDEITLRDVLEAALLQTAPNQNLSSKDQVERFIKAQMIHGRDWIQFTSDEIVLLKEQTAKLYAPLVTGQVALILEGELGDYREVTEDEEQ